MWAHFAAAIIILVAGTNGKNFFSSGVLHCLLFLSYVLVPNSISTCSSGSHGAAEAGKEAKGEMLVESFSLTENLQKATFRDLPAGRDWRRMLE